MPDLLSELDDSYFLSSRAHRGSTLPQGMGWQSTVFDVSHGHFWHHRLVSSAFTSPVEGTALANTYLVSFDWSLWSYDSESDVLIKGEWLTVLMRNDIFSYGIIAQMLQVKVNKKVGTWLLLALYFWTSSFTSHLQFPSFYRNWSQWFLQHTLSPANELD